MSFLSCDQNRVIINQKIYWKVTNFDVVTESDSTFKTGANNGRLRRPYDEITERLVVTVEFKKLNRSQFDSLYQEIVNGVPFTIIFDSGIGLQFIFFEHTITKLIPQKDGYVFGFTAKSLQSFPSPFISRALGKPIINGCNQDEEDPCCYDIQYNENVISNGGFGNMITYILNDKEKPCGGIEIISGFENIGLYAFANPLLNRIEFYPISDSSVVAGTYPVEVMIWNSCRYVVTTINVTVPPPVMLNKTITFDAFTSSPSVENLLLTSGSSEKIWDIEDPNPSGAISNIVVNMVDTLPATDNNESVSLSILGWTGSSWIYQAQWFHASGTPILINTSTPPAIGAITYGLPKYRIVANITTNAPSYPEVDVTISVTSNNAPNPEIYNILLTT